MKNVVEIKIQKSYVVLTSVNKTLTFYSNVDDLKPYLQKDKEYDFEVVDVLPPKSNFEIIRDSVTYYIPTTNWQVFGQNALEIGEFMRKNSMYHSENILPGAYKHIQFFCLGLCLFFFTFAKFEIALLQPVYAKIRELYA